MGLNPVNHGVSTAEKNTCSNLLNPQSLKGIRSPSDTRRRVQDTARLPRHVPLTPSPNPREPPYASSESRVLPEHTSLPRSPPPSLHPAPAATEVGVQNNFLAQVLALVLYEGLEVDRTFGGEYPSGSSSTRWQNANFLDITTSGCSWK